MGVYHQLGDKSISLLKEQRLGNYRGAILIPVNYSETETAAQVAEYGLGFELIFDPQLYFPKTARGRLSTWSHYPKDVDTADFSSAAWWTGRVNTISELATRLGVKTVCSPVVAPSNADASYYSLAVGVAD